MVGVGSFAELIVGVGSPTNRGAHHRESAVVMPSRGECVEGAAADDRGCRPLLCVAVADLRIVAASPAVDVTGRCVPATVLRAYCDIEVAEASRYGHRRGAVGATPVAQLSAV